MHEFASAVGKVLDSGRRVMVYSGKEDFICNYVGGAEWTNATSWSQQVRHEEIFIEGIILSWPRHIMGFRLLISK